MVSESVHADPSRVGVDRDDRSGETGTTVLELDGITKRYGPETAVSDLSLSVRDGELLTLLGPSGCGKTTTLRMIAGLERPDEGAIRIDEDPVAGEEFVDPEDRDVGIVFQNFALFPHLTAAENVGFGLESWDREAREARVAELLDLVGLADHADSTPTELSGGQQQRIALARSLAPEPEILLLDEPFSNLDVDLRVEMREEVRRILTETGVTGISVTHDQEEAMSISDRVAVMSEGRLMQVGRPEAVFQHPESRFVAGFLGHASFLSGYVTDDLVETELGSVGRDRIHGLAPEYDRTRIDVLVRPDDVLVRPADGETADGRVTYRRYLGPTVLYRVELDDGEVVEAMHNHAQQVSLDTPVTVDLAATHELAWFPTEDH
ncbi:ABC transporter ATP-binding protein [Halalkalicoccus jeotgali]|uniref:Molybdate/tungstate import ATP-binding protein WtpC n=1 Tax=Halalkalicoccus jeotgali (strain DSM 18796 / CECT 7217 / JCM 14584 / KCTC 4019 / B3) TaxID=795797 RepID=D8J3K6_HALJB|nr:ABC transporter ATP-binding protein [Halalkalicoccus jeotgali]ADJ15313.1 ABC transporter related protein [Halalkalicoccus jeotgali B3]ELY35474.1 ABC transporter-like protein [Halalkalicoccus jeotgali B3]